jgi:hypothetical protein
MVPLSSCWVRVNHAGALHAAAARGDGEVGGAKERAHAKDSSERDERARPPNVPGEMKDGVGAANLLPVAHQNAHLAEQLLLREIEVRADPGKLEREEDETAGSKVRLHAAGPAAAELAVAIEEDPSEEGK